jgi:Ca-activated chloride channel family protein
VALISALNASAGAAAQDAQRPTFDANVELVLMDVAVLGDGGVPVAGLTEQDFLVEEDGEERQVGLAMSASGAPLDIVLAIDLSGSMVDEPWQQGASRFLAALDPRRDCVLMMGFSSGVGASIWAPPNHPALSESMELSVVRGGTALFDAVVAAAGALSETGGRSLRGMLTAWEEEVDADRSGPPPPITTSGCPVPYDPSLSLDPTRRRRRAAVLITDGADSGSGFREDHALRAAQAAGVPVFHIGSSRTRVLASSSRSNETGVRNIALGRGGSFERIVEATGGARIAANTEAFSKLLDHLRSFYVVGYYVPRPAVGTKAEIRRHEVKVRLRAADAELLYARVGYRSTIDRVRVDAELAAARRRLSEGDLDAALFAADNALATDPNRGDALALRAEILERQGRFAEACDDALAAADLAPGDATTHLLAARLALAAGKLPSAWEQGIRAAQADPRENSTRTLFEELTRQNPPPEDLLERIDAPSVALVVGPSRNHDIFARAALAKAMTAIGAAIAEHPRLALTRARVDGAFAVVVSDRDVDDEPPRRFRGRIRVLDTTGNEIYDEDFTLHALDDRERNAADLADDVREIARRIGEARE